ncbi:MAG: galactokinase family protein [Acutalibacteraceae bacterium]
MQTSYRFSAPGRTEISGNHTDHQHGCVLAAAVDLETTAEVTLRPDSIIRVASEGYAPVEIDLNDLSVHAEEKNTTAALVRGVAAAFAQRGCKLHGFDAAVRSTVLPGSGLSSSAAFEVLIGTICNELFFDKNAPPSRSRRSASMPRTSISASPAASWIRWPPASAGWSSSILPTRRTPPSGRRRSILRTAATRSARSIPARITQI